MKLNRRQFFKRAGVMAAGAAAVAVVGLPEAPAAKNLAPPHDALSPTAFDAPMPSWGVGVPEGRPLPPTPDPISDAWPVVSWGAATTDLIYISGNTFTTSSNDIWVYSHNGELRDEWGHAITV